MLLGVAAAFGRGNLPAVWFDALARHAADAERLEWETNSRRSEARAMGRGR